MWVVLLWRIAGVWGYLLSHFVCCHNKVFPNRSSRVFFCLGIQASQHPCPPNDVSACPLPTSPGPSSFSLSFPHQHPAITHHPITCTLNNNPSFVSGRAKEQTTSAHCHQYTPPTLYCSCTPAGCASSVVLSLHPHLRCARP